MSNELIGGRVIRSCALVIVREGGGGEERGRGRGFVEQSQKRVDGSLTTYQLIDNTTGGFLAPRVRLAGLPGDSTGRVDHVERSGCYAAGLVFPFG